MRPFLAAALRVPSPVPVFSSELREAAARQAQLRPRDVSGAGASPAQRDFGALVTMQRVYIKGRKLY